MNSKKIKTIIVVSSVVISVFSSVGIIKNVSYFNRLNREKTAITKLAVSKKSAYEKYKEEVNKKFYLDANNSNNKLVQQVSAHNSSYIIMDNLSKEFFKTYLTWSNSEDYNSRANKLGNVADSSLLDNKTIFDNGKDSTGGDYIKSLDLQSAFVDSEVSLIDNQSGIVKVTYNSWYGKKSNSGETTQYYLVSFDRDNQKINNITAVYISEKG